LLTENRKEALEEEKFQVEKQEEKLKPQEETNRLCCQKGSLLQRRMETPGWSKPEAPSTAVLLSKGPLRQSLEWNEFTRKSKMACHGASQLS